MPHRPARRAWPGAVHPAGPTGRRLPKEALDGIDPVVLLTQGKEVSGKADLESRARPVPVPVRDAREQGDVREVAGEVRDSARAGRARGWAAASPGIRPTTPSSTARSTSSAATTATRSSSAAPAKFLPQAAPPDALGGAGLRGGRGAGRTRGEGDRRRANAGRGDDLRRVLFADAEAADRRRVDRDEDDVALARRRPRGAHDRRCRSHADERQPDHASPAAGSSAADASIRRTPRGARPPSAKYNRQLVPLLRARREAGFKAAAAGRRDRGRRRRWIACASSTAPSTSRSAIDKASGLSDSVSFIGRGFESEIGDYVDRRSADYRDVSGLRLPFSERAIFNGAPDPLRTRTIRHDCDQPPLDPRCSSRHRRRAMRPLVALAVRHRRARRRQLGDLVAGGPRLAAMGRARIATS